MRCNILQTLILIPRVPVLVQLDLIQQALVWQQWKRCLILAIDPSVITSGIGEDAIVNVVLPLVHSAQEGVALLGHIIETQATAEGFGGEFVDKEGIW